MYFYIIAIGIVLYLLYYLSMRPYYKLKGKNAFVKKPLSILGSYPSTDFGKVPQNEHFKIVYEDLKSHVS